MSEAEKSHDPRGPLWTLLALLALVALGAVWPSVTSRQPDGVDDLNYRSDAFYAEVGPTVGWGQSRWVRSHDGGFTWTVVDSSAVPPLRLDNTPDVACAYDGVCYRNNDEGYSIERGSTDVDARWTVEYASDTRLDGLSVNPDDSNQAMMIVGREQIVRRSPGGTWSVIDAAAMPTPVPGIVVLDAFQRSPLGLVGVGILLCALGSRRYGSVGRPLGVWVGVNFLVGAALTYLGVDRNLAATPDGFVPAAGLWLVIGLTILALPVPWPASTDFEEDRW